MTPASVQTSASRVLSNVNVSPPFAVMFFGFTYVPSTPRYRVIQYVPPAEYERPESSPEHGDTLPQAIRSASRNLESPALPESTGPLGDGLHERGPSATGVVPSGAVTGIP